VSSPTRIQNPKLFFFVKCHVSEPPRAATISGLVHRRRRGARDSLRLLREDCGGWSGRVRQRGQLGESTPILVEEAMAVYRAGLSDEHSVSGSREPGGGPSGGRHCRVLAAVASDVGHGHGPPDPAPLGTARRGHWEAPRRALPRGIPSVGSESALDHGRARSHWLRYSGGYWECYCY